MIDVPISYQKKFEDLYALPVHSEAVVEGDVFAIVSSPQLLKGCESLLRTYYVLYISRQEYY